MHAETFWTLITNAPHWEFEIVSSLIQDSLIGFVIWPFVKRFVKRQHLKLDKEHGVEHNEPNL